MLLRNLPQAVEKISHNCYTTALFIINFATSPIHAENTLITLHYKKEIISLFLETTPIKVTILRSILDYIEQEQLTAEKRNHCMKLSKKIHREKTIQPTVNLNDSAFFCNLLLTLFFVAICH